MLLDRINAWLLAILLTIAPCAAEASQGNLYSPTTGTVSGLQLTNNYNSGLDALNTCNSGSSAPINQLSGSPSLGNCWINNSSGPYPWQVYDGSTTWTTPFWIDAANHMTNVKIGGGTNTIASASTVDLCGASVAPMAYLSITGTIAITSFGSPCKAGHVKIVTFTGILTLTYNATSMIIPGAANVTTAAGDQAVVISLGSGNWQIVSYAPANGQALINPSVDIGTYLFTSAVSVPSSKYLLAYGQAISRATYASYLSTVTITQSVTATNGSPTLTGFSDTTQIAAGAAVEATFVPNGTTISSCTSTTCTMSANASSSTTGNVTIFPYGNGCGFGTSCGTTSTTFNMPDCRDIVMVGRGNMGGTARSDSYFISATYFGASPNALGVFGGSQNTALAAGNIPTITSSGVNFIAVYPSNNSSVNIPGTLSGNISNLNGAVGGSGINLPKSDQGNWTGINTFEANNTISVTYSNGSPTPISRVPPSLTANCMVRVLASLERPLQQLAANDNHVEPLAIIERRRAA